MSQRVVSIIQARTRSTRLPGKALIEVGGLSLLARHYDRVRRCSYLDAVVVAIPEGEQDDDLHAYCVRHGWDTFRGPEQDVLARYVGAAVWKKADVIVRTTADCPFIDPGVIGGVVELYSKGEFDYVSNNLERTFPHGLDVEVFSRDALEEAHSKAKDVFEREHVTEYIRRHQDRPFRLGNLRFPIEDQAENIQRILREARLTVDYPEDLLVATQIIDFWERETRFITTADIVWILDRVPEIMQLNAQRAIDHAQALRGEFEPMSVDERAAWDRRGEEK